MHWITERSSSDRLRIDVFLVALTVTVLGLLGKRLLFVALTCRGKEERASKGD